MSWFDSLSSIFSGGSGAGQGGEGGSGGGGWATGLGGLLNAGMGAYSLYQGAQNTQQANKYYRQLEKSGKLQERLMQEDAARNRPVLDAEALAALQDALRYTRGDFNGMRGQIDEAAYQNALLRQQQERAGLNAINPWVPGMAEKRARNQAALDEQIHQNIQEVLPWQRRHALTELALGAHQHDIQSKLLGLTGDYLPGITANQYRLADATAKMQLGEQPLVEQFRRMQLQSQIGDMQDYEKNRGIEQEFMRQSLKGVDPRMRMDRAAADVEHAFAGASQALGREIARRGVSQSSGQSLDMQRQNMIDKALGRASARTRAAEEAQRENYARLGNAVNVRNGLAPAGREAQMALPHAMGMTGGINAQTPYNAQGLSIQQAGMAPRQSAPYTRNSSAQGSGAIWQNLADLAGQQAKSNMQNVGYALGRAFG